MCAAVGLFTIARCLPPQVVSCVPLLVLLRTDTPKQGGYYVQCMVWGQLPCRDTCVEGTTSGPLSGAATQLPAGLRFGWFWCWHNGTYSYGLAGG